MRKDGSRKRKGRDGFSRDGHLVLPSVGMSCAICDVLVIQAYVESARRRTERGHRVTETQTETHREV